MGNMSRPLRSQMEDELKAQVHMSRSLRTQMEDKLKAKISEPASDQVHEGVYQKVKGTTAPVSNMIANTVLELIGDDHSIERKIDLERRIIELREALYNNPKERDLQNRLLEIEELAGVRTASLSEVYIYKPSGRRGRIDILALPDSEKDLGRIIELKRTSLKLIVNRNGQKPSRGFKRASRQVGVYGQSKLIWRGEALKDFQKTIIAGRRQVLPGAYFLIAEEEQTESVDVYTWDAWTDLMERTLT